MVWSTEEAHFCVEAYFTYKSYKTVQCKYRETMCCEKTPAKSLICAWVKEFKEFGSVESLDSKFCWPKRARTEENINAVRKSLAQNPEKSLRDRSQELGISVTTLHRILKMDLNLQVKQSCTEENISTVRKLVAQNPEKSLGSEENLNVPFGWTKETRTEKNIDAVRKPSVSQNPEKSLGSALNLCLKIGRPKRVRTEENITAVRKSLAEKPDQSLRIRSLELGMSVTTVHRILKIDLNLSVKKSHTGENISAIKKLVAQNPEKSLGSGENLYVPFGRPKEVRNEENIDAVRKLVAQNPEKPLELGENLGSIFGRPKGARTEENINAVRKSMAENPNKSIKQRSKELGMSVTTLHRIIKLDLNLKIKQSRTQENINAVWKSVAQNPEQSIRKRSKELGLSVSMVHRILKKDMNL